MRGIIENVERAKSGNSLKVWIAGMEYYTKKWELQEKVGHAITFDPKPNTYNQKTYHWINDYTFDDGGHSHQGPAPGFDGPTLSPPAQRPPEPARAPQIDRDASIVAQALTKACSAPGDDPAHVWQRYTFFYGNYMAWDPRYKDGDNTVHRSSSQRPEDEYDNEPPPY